MECFTIVFVLFSVGLAFVITNYFYGEKFRKIEVNERSHT